MLIRRSLRVRGLSTLSAATPAAPKLLKSTVVAGGRGLQLNWASSDPTKSPLEVVSTFDASWLAHNCNCAKCRQASSGQRLARPASYDHRDLFVTDAETDPEGEKVTVTIARVTPNEAGHVTEFTSDWLRAHAYDETLLTKERNGLEAVDAPTELARVAALPRLGWKEILEKKEEGALSWMERLLTYGVCVVDDVPATPEGLLEFVATTKGCEPSHTLYGKTFHVESVPDPINVAYSNEALEPHQDLAYYESPPGIQLLHCLAFDETIQGGESTFVDAHAAAETLRVRNPKAFRDLTRLPCTFQKDHVKRANPAKMSYRRPHIQVDASDRVVAVYWAPPFEGPLRVDPRDVEAYYDAYQAFDAILKSEELWARHGLRLKLEPGRLVVFNNRRALHGRGAFVNTSPDSKRHLHGCYLDMDTFLNRYRVMRETGRPKLRNDMGKGLDWGFPLVGRAGNGEHR